MFPKGGTVRYHDALFGGEGGGDVISHEIISNSKL